MGSQERRGPGEGFREAEILRLKDELERTGKSPKPQKITIPS